MGLSINAIKSFAFQKIGKNLQLLQKYCAVTMADTQSSMVTNYGVARELP